MGLIGTYCLDAQPDSLMLINQDVTLMDFDIHFPEGLFNGSIPRAELETIIQKTHSAYLKQ